jgi:protein-tyrosine phosphatase
MFNFPNSNLYLTNKKEYLENINSYSDQEWTFVHIGEDLYNTQKVISNDPIFINKNHLYLNYQDLPDEKTFRVGDLNKTIDFIDKNNDKKVLIHCDYGHSRSPAIMMLYLAKRTKLLPNNFFLALEKFIMLYPDYLFTSGISKFIKKNWTKIEGT